MTDLSSMYMPEPNSGCWLWTGATLDAGYGAIQVSGKTRRAHRVVFESERGPIPDGLVLDHLCRNRLCVNPNHLEPVTLVENILRGDGAPAVNARKTHCDRGHGFTDENTRLDHRGARLCLECTRERGRKNAAAYRARRRAALERPHVTALSESKGEQK